jgi:choline dehydrogenase-like flavoprotein
LFISILKILKEHMSHKRWIISTLCLLNCFTNINAKHSSCSDNISYDADYIVVGVGTAGALVAKELSDDKCNSVIAIHIGKNQTEDPLVKYSKNAPITVGSGLLGDIPTSNLPPSLKILLEKLFSGLSFYISGHSIPQPDANNRALLWIMALPEGGASSINAGAWCRGTNQLYAEWESIVGPDWSVNRVLDIYKSLENYHGLTDNPASRGFKGPIDIRQVPATVVSLKFTWAIIEATGLPFQLDYNDPLTPVGIASEIQLTQKGKNGKLRVSSATAFLNNKVMTPDGHGVNGRKLQVLFNSQALRTIWEGNKAVGVEYLHKGKVKKVFAKKGVVVCAGLYSSPFLLHSGVGPQGLLQSLGIPVIYNNPNVGQGLADQPHIVLAYETNPKDTPVRNPNSIFAEISWLPAPGGDQTERKLRFTTANPFPGITIAILDLVQPKSRGSVSINSPDPLAQPVIDFEELSNPEDFALFVSAFQNYVKKINDALLVMDPLYKMIFPDPAVLDDPILLNAFIRNEVGSNMHFQSHCRMAPQDQGGVVDSKGRVYGVKNLYVADNSIVPLCMDGSPMASGYLIGANVARMIKSSDH